MPWELYQSHPLPRGGHTRQTLPGLRLSGSKGLLNKAAYALIGQPPAIRLYHHASPPRIGVQACVLSDHNHVTIHRGYGAMASFIAIGYLTAYTLWPYHGHQYLGHMEGDMLVFDLTERIDQGQSNA